MSPNSAKNYHDNITSATTGLMIMPVNNNHTSTVQVIHNWDTSVPPRTRTLPDDKIFEIPLYLSVRDAISFQLIHTRHLKTPNDWIRFVTYATSSPTRDGIGSTVKRAITRHLATRELYEITRHEAITLTKVAPPHPDQITNLRPLFDNTGELF